jgi:hypothetical protein
VSRSAHSRLEVPGARSSSASGLEIGPPHCSVPSTLVTAREGALALSPAASRALGIGALGEHQWSDPFPIHLIPIDIRRALGF